MRVEMFFVLFLASVIAIGLLASAASASSSVEYIYICKPCSRNFIPDMNKVITELGLEDKLEVKTTGCLGYCTEPAVISFRDEVYSNMDSDKFRQMLGNFFGVKIEKEVS